MRYIFILIFLFAATSVSAAEVLSIKEAMRANPKIKYFKVKNRIRLNLKRFPIASSPNSSWENPIIPEAFIITIPNGKVYSKHGIVIIKDSVLKETIWPWSKLKKNPNSLNIKKLPTAKYVPGRVLVLAQEGSHNYYHWMTEILPKLASVEKAKIKYDWIYVPEQTSNFMKETLNLLGVKPEKIISAKKNSFLRAEELIVPSFVSRSCYTPFWVAKYLRDKLIPPAINDKNINLKHLPKKIFISRSKATYRKILNEEEISKKLAEKGFVSINLEELSVKKQIALFNNANVIVAPHGAGLTNLLFAKPKTTVIEIFQAHENDTYWHLSQTLKLNHHCIKTTPFLKNGGYSNTKVSWEKLEEKLNSIPI